MRLIDADNLINLVTDSTILGGGFKQAFCAIVNGEPTVEQEQKVGSMTREDAIYELERCKSIIQKNKMDWLDERDIPVLDMAIDALEALTSAETQTD